MVVKLNQIKTEQFEHFFAFLTECSDIVSVRNFYIQSS